MCAVFSKYLFHLCQEHSAALLYLSVLFYKFIEIFLCRITFSIYPAYPLTELSPKKGPYFFWQILFYKLFEGTKLFMCVIAATYYPVKASLAYFSCLVKKESQITRQRHKHFSLGQKDRCNHSDFL